MSTQPLRTARSNCFVPRKALGKRGFTVLEMCLTLAVAGILFAIGLRALRNFMEQQRADRSADAVLWQITVARSYAIRSGESVDLVVDKANRRLLVQDTVKTWSVLNMGPGSGLTVDSLDLPIAGNKLTFSFRGFCLNCSTSGVMLSLYAGGRKRQIQIGFLGKADKVKG